MRVDVVFDVLLSREIMPAKGYNTLVVVFSSRKRTPRPYFPRRFFRDERACLFFCPSAVWRFRGSSFLQGESHWRAAGAQDRKGKQYEPKLSFKVRRRCVKTSKIYCIVVSLPKCSDVCIKLRFFVRFCPNTRQK